MPANQRDQRETDEAKTGGHLFDDAVGRHVLHTLGQPGDLHRIQVRQLWSDHYRVNVLVGPDAASAKVAHSFFLVVDKDGNIVKSTPQLLRRY